MQKPNLLMKELDHEGKKNLDLSVKISYPSPLLLGKNILFIRIYWTCLVSKSSVSTFHLFYSIFKS